MYWLFFPLYVTRLACILEWLERRGWDIVWHGPGHWFNWPTLERADQMVFEDESIEDGKDTTT